MILRIINLYCILHCSLFIALTACTALAAPIVADPELTGTPLYVSPPAQPDAMPAQQIAPPPPPPQQSATSRMFGAQLFTGSMSNTLGPSFNPNYLLTVGDRVQLKMWGAFNYEGQLTVDPQGNIFIPNVGPVHLTGVSNGNLNQIVTREITKIYQANVNVYAALDIAQPIKVYVTGFVNRPGLYSGVASDSLLSYLDKAGGVNAASGSYIDIQIKRGNKIRKQVNLYDFLLNGALELVQFNDGDVIVVGPRQHTFSVEGAVFNDYDFEFSYARLPVSEALAWARPKPGATHLSIIRQQGSAKRSEYYPLRDASKLTLQDGDKLTVTSDRYPGTIQVRVEGAHSGEHAVVLPYGATMKQILAQLHNNSMSQLSAIQLFRKSVATRQKEMLELALNKLEEASLTTPSATNEESKLRIQEAELISRFVKIARNITMKGQVVLDGTNIADVILEDGDIITIPERTSLVIIHGSVIMPNAVIWQQGLSAKEYIDKVGGFTQTADKAKVILVRQNGVALNADEAKNINAGDEIMVLPKVESKNIEVTRGISTILYQLAVAAKVIVDI